MIQALRALALVGDNPHLPLVLSALQDKRPEVRHQAA